MRIKYGTRSYCKVCGQDVEYVGRKVWTDRGGSSTCPAYFDADKQEYVKPENQKHVAAARG